MGVEAAQSQNRVLDPGAQLSLPTGGTDCCHRGWAPPLLVPPPDRLCFLHCLQRSRTVYVLIHRRIFYLCYAPPLACPESVSPLRQMIIVSHPPRAARIITHTSTTFRSGTYAVEPFIHSKRVALNDWYSAEAVCPQSRAVAVVQISDGKLLLDFLEVAMSRII